MQRKVYINGRFDPVSSNVNISPLSLDLLDRLMPSGSVVMIGNVCAGGDEGVEPSQVFR